MDKLENRQKRKPAHCKAKGETRSRRFTVDGRRLLI
jgi:hypothetical protein